MLYRIPKEIIHSPDTSFDVYININHIIKISRYEYGCAITLSDNSMYSLEINDDDFKKND